ncbi:hypothetical protein [Pseudomonas sp. UBA4194]|jgi:hypothetical protein|uniref:hypothetical protein n=1 Tax=Pseudomonas sp. UBA4194 TaxID=1947317 RepID=UPI0025E28C74|nr:hypothetical protein [Pseudomonas sp. UBA4194]
MLNDAASQTVEQTNQVSRVIAQQIRSLHNSASRDLDKAAAEIMGRVEAFRVQGLISAAVAQQLTFDVRNERSRISR